MDVELLRIDGCPNWELAARRIREAADRAGIAVELGIRILTPDDNPHTLGFTGSPTILIDGRNPFGGQPTRELACRVYETDAGIQGAPSVGQIEDALARAP